MNISFVSDIVCPFCYIGFSQLQKALASRPAIEASIGALPFQLDPEVPEQGVPFQQYMAQRFGESSQQMLEQATAMAAAEGLALRFDLITVWPNTLKAHRLLAICPTEQRLALYDTLFKAVFCEGRNISDIDVLIELAASVGLEVDTEMLNSAELIEQTDRMLQATLAMGVQSAPLFIFEEDRSVAGAQGADAIVRAIDAAAAAA